MIILGLFLALMVCAGIYIYYLFFWLGKHEPDTEADKTNTDAVYSEEALEKKLSQYPSLKLLGFEGLNEENSFVIPGLKATRTLTSNQAENISVCTSMTPQGICAAEKYLLISAYCHTKEHNSVIYVLDKETHKFLKEIVLKGRPHVGGLAYDTVNRNVWVACYKNKTAYVNAFSLDEMEKYDLDKGTKPLAFEFGYPIYSLPRASFLYYEEGGLYVGYFSTARHDDLRTIQKYWIEEDGKIETQKNPFYGKDDISEKDEEVIMPADVASIDAACQGMAFSENLILISKSRGILKSKLQMFQNAVSPEETVMKLQNTKALWTMTLPPQLEQLYVYDGELYLLFESGAYAYRSWPTISMDRVLKLDLAALTEGGKSGE